MKENFDIESIFKNNLEGFEADPGINAWTSIQSKLSAAKTASVVAKSAWLAKGIKTALLVIGTLAGGIGIGYMVFDGNTNEPTNQPTVNTTNHISTSNNNEIFITDENISVKEISSINKPDKVLTILEVKKEGEESQKVLVEIRQGNYNNGSIITNWLSNSNQPNKDLIERLLNEIDKDNTEVPSTNQNDYLIVQKLQENEIIAGIKASHWSGQAPLTVEFNNITEAKTYDWSFGDNSTSKEANPKHVFETPGNYVVELTITDANGKAKSNKTLIEVTAATETLGTSSIEKYNVFTPNADGENDEFKLTGTNISDFEMMIYDNKGNLVFSSSSINQSWNGTDRKGNVLPEGQYQCVYKAIGTDGVEHNDKILVMLSRQKR